MRLNSVFPTEWSGLVLVQCNMNPELSHLVPFVFEAKLARVGSALGPGSSVHGPIIAALRQVLDPLSPSEAKPSAAEPSEAESSTLAKLCGS